MKERSAAVSVVGGSESNLRDSMQSEDVVKCLHAHVTCGNSQIHVCKIPEVDRVRKYSTQGKVPLH